MELSPCGRWAYVGNRVGVGVDGACADCVEGSISVLRVDGAEVELVVSRLDSRERQRETGRNRGRQRETERETSFWFHWFHECVYAGVHLFSTAIAVVNGLHTL